MRYFTAIFAIYFCCLTLYPCGDTHASCSDDETHEVDISSHEEGNSDDHTDADLCSPFCHCHCCQINTTQIGFNTFTLPTPKTYKTVFGVSEGISEKAIIILLKPPQFVV